MQDQPKTLRDEGERQRRRRLLASPHMTPLVNYVAQLRESKGAKYHILDFDPMDGGVDARVLVLLEAPGPKTVESGFISRNNPDESAKNFFNAFATAQIARCDTIVWNVIPWYIGSGSKIRPGTVRDIAEAKEPVAQLFELLPNLQAVVLMGDKAKRAYTRLNHRSNVEVFETLHPSPIVYGTRKTARDEILHVLKKVARWLT